MPLRNYSLTHLYHWLTQIMCLLLRYLLYKPSYRRFCQLQHCHLLSHFFVWSTSLDCWIALISFLISCAAVLIIRAFSCLGSLCSWQFNSCRILEAVLWNVTTFGFPFISAMIILSPRCFSHWFFHVLEASSAMNERMWSIRSWTVICSSSFCSRYLVTQRKVVNT